MEKQDIQIKTIKPFLVICKEGLGGVDSFNRDLDNVYRFLYQNKLEKYICGPSLGLFYSSSKGKYLACVPLKKKIETEQNLQIKTLPRIKAVVSLHTKDTSLINNTFKRLFTFIKQKDLNWSWPVREIYYPKGNDKYEIEIQIPLK